MEKLKYILIIIYAIWITNCINGNSKENKAQNNRKKDLIDINIEILDDHSEIKLEIINKSDKDFSLNNLKGKILQNQGYDKIVENSEYDSFKLFLSHGFEIHDPGSSPIKKKSGYWPGFTTTEFNRIFNLWDDTSDVILKPNSKFVATYNPDASSVLFENATLEFQFKIENEIINKSVICP